MSIGASVPRLALEAVALALVATLIATISPAAAQARAVAPQKEAGNVLLPAPGRNGKRIAVLNDGSFKAPRRASEEVHAPLVGSRERSVTIRFSYYADVPYAEDRPESEVSCSLRLPRGSDGVGVLRAALDQDCIRSFRTVREHGRVMLHCINHVCARVTNSPGIVPDTRWDADWTGDGGSDWQSAYWRFGLQGFSASDGDWFTAYLYAVN